jgi:peptidoglycan hydrolase CwlO-like protein
MKAVLISIGFLIALAAVGAGGFLVGYQQYEKSLQGSNRSPVKLEGQIATLEQEKVGLQAQVNDLLQQVASGVKAQAEASKAVADLEKALAEQKSELKAAREKLQQSQDSPAIAPPAER